MIGGKKTRLSQMTDVIMRVRVMVRVRVRARVRG
jgi:hypothetical protein